MKKFKVQFQNKIIEVDPSKNLRDELLQAGLSPYNGSSEYLNCRGFGSCGTCALEVKGKLSPKTRMEKWRLNFPPHKADYGLRLACQVKAQSDLSLKKHNGFWGSQLEK